MDALYDEYAEKIFGTSSQDFFITLRNVISKYSNGDYGFDNNDNTKYCIL